ncbi:MAG: cupin domain-containing protein [Alphaproteobacteria bacterium]
MFVILEGIGTLRYDGERHPVRQGDVIFTPTGPGTAHQIINTSDAELRYMALAPMSKRRYANIRTRARSALLAATYISSPRPAPRSTTGTAGTARRKAPWHAPRRPRPCGGRPR